MVIYLDILIVLNLFVDYFLLLSCSIISNLYVKKKRLILGAILGGLFSVFILLPESNIFLSFIVKVCIALILILVTFGYKSKQLFIKTFLVFFVENFIFIGVMFFIWFFFSPPGMLWKNGITYITISPVVLIVSSFGAYVITSIFNSIFERKIDKEKIYSIEINFNNKKVFLNALYDSGNCLIEPFSGKSACICEYEKLISLFPDEFIKFFNDFFKNVNAIRTEEFKKLIKIIPCDTITGSAVLPAFLPNSFYILKKNGERRKYDGYVAVTSKKVSDGEFNAIIGDFN